MRFTEFSKIFSESDSYIPSRDEIRHFASIKSGKKVDYSKDFHNQVLKKFYILSLKISNEKLRKKFAEIIYRNMGDVVKLISEIKILNNSSIDNNQKEEIAKYIQNMEN